MREGPFEVAVIASVPFTYVHKGSLRSHSAIHLWSFRPKASHGATVQRILTPSGTNYRICSDDGSPPTTDDGSPPTCLDEHLPGRLFFFDVSIFYSRRSSFTAGEAYGKLQHHWV